jgi:hypothetical protein
MCNGARRHRCWFSFGFCGADAASAIAAAVEAELDALEGFDAQLAELVELAGREGGAVMDRERDELRRDDEARAREQENLLATIGRVGPVPMIVERIAALEARSRELARRRTSLEVRGARAPKLPASAAEIRDLFSEKFRGLARDSPEFGDVLRRVVPEFHVYAVRLCDGGHPLPRARAVLNLAGIVPDARRAPGFTARLTRVLTLDLFRPPQRERIRAEAVRLSAEGWDQRRIARRLGVTQPAVTNALILDRTMKGLGIGSPYVVMDGPPTDYPKLRRHLHPRYRFEAEEGYLHPAL